MASTEGRRPLAGIGEAFARAYAARGCDLAANAAHPDGLANGSGQVGRNYMFHTLTAMVSLTSCHVDVTFPKTLAVNDFYWGDPRGGYDKPSVNPTLTVVANAMRAGDHLKARLAG